MAAVFDGGDGGETKKFGLVKRSQVYIRATVCLAEEMEWEKSSTKILRRIKQIDK